jgi:hypothetical protein
MGAGPEAQPFRQTQHAGVFLRDIAVESRDARTAGLGHEPADQCRTQADVLPVVGNRQRKFSPEWKRCRRDAGDSLGTND